MQPEAPIDFDAPAVLRKWPLLHRERRTDGTPPYSLQWVSNGIAIPGATNFMLTTSPLSATASGANYSIVLSNEFSSATSTNGRLTVIPDTTAPTIALVQNLGTSIVNVTFSEAVQPASATNVSNYALNPGISISMAVLSADNRTVALTVSPLSVLNAVVGPVPREAGEEPGAPAVSDARSTSPGAPEQQQPRPPGPV